VNVGRATEALTLQKPLVVASLSILAHGSMPWESRTMVAVAVQGASHVLSSGLIIFELTHATLSRATRCLLFLICKHTILILVMVLPTKTASPSIMSFLIIFSLRKSALSRTVSVDGGDEGGEMV
jgi:hypothetical protein